MERRLSCSFLPAHIFCAGVKLTCSRTPSGIACGAALRVASVVLDPGALLDANSIISTTRKPVAVPTFHGFASGASVQPTTATVFRSRQPPTALSSRLRPRTGGRDSRSSASIRKSHSVVRPSRRTHGPDLTSWQAAAFVRFTAAFAALAYRGNALLFSTGAAGSLCGRFRRATDALFGAAFGRLGVTIMTDGLRGARRQRAQVSGAGQKFEMAVSTDGHNLGVLSAEEIGVQGLAGCLRSERPARPWPPRIAEIDRKLMLGPQIGTPRHFGQPAIVLEPRARNARSLSATDGAVRAGRDRCDDSVPDGNGTAVCKGWTSLARGVSRWAA